MHTLEQQSQHKTLKRIKIDINIEEEEDRISLLPDCLLIEILSRLPYTREAIKTGILSKRWRHLWPLVHNLIFIDYVNAPLVDFYKLVDKTLAQCRHLKLNKFKLDASFIELLEPQVKYWIRGAINLNVNELDLSFCKKLKDVLVFDSEVFFINSNFIHLKLSCSKFNPTGAISWKNLKSLCISRGKLDEGLIQNMLSGSPLLETLKLEDCYGFRLINITSKSVKHLEFNGSLNRREHQLEGGEEIIEINAPNILTLTIPRLLSWKLVLLNVSSLVEANLEYYAAEYLYYHIPNEDEQERLKGLILSLRHVKEVKLEFFCSKVLYDLEAKGFSWQSNVTCVDKHFVNERLLKMKRLSKSYFQKNDTSV